MPSDLLPFVLSVQAQVLLGEKEGGIREGAGHVTVCESGGPKVKQRRGSRD